MWKGTPSEELVLKDMCKENGDEWPHGDRRQELVFIGHDMKHEAIQRELDRCLLTDDEMELGREKWEEIMASVDKIQGRGNSVEYNFAWALAYNNHFDWA